MLCAQPTVRGRPRVLVPVGDPTLPTGPGTGRRPAAASVETRRRRGRLAAPSREAQGLPLFVAATPEAARARAGRPPRVPRRAGRRGPGPSSPPPGGARGPGGAVVPSGERWPPPRRSGGSPPRPPAALGDASPIAARGEPQLGAQPAPGALPRQPARPAATMRAEGDGGLERFCSPGKGRGLRALQPFQVGDLLFSCPAYAYVLTVNERGNHCEHCFAR